MKLLDPEHITVQTEPPRRIFCLLLAILLVAGIAVYGNSLFNGFAWDDTKIIVENQINRDFSNINQVLFGSDVVFADAPTYYYRPLNRLTYMIEFYLYGLQPMGYHLVNLLIHIANIALLFLLGLKIFRLPLAAFIAALLFAIHPINTEAVNFISGRNNVLATFFVLLTVLFFLRGERTNSRRDYTLAGIAHFCGLLCKEIAFMTPLVLFLSPILAEGQSWPEALRQRVKNLIPCVVAALCYLALRVMVLQAVADQVPWASRWQKLVQNVYVIPKYLSLVLFPLDLRNFHYIPADYSDHWGILLLIWLALAGIIVLLLKHGGVSAARFGLLWVCVNYIPLSQIIPFGGAPISERFIYLPAIGVWLLVGSCVEGISVRGWPRTLLLSGLAGLVCMLALLTWQRNYVWRDDVSLFSALVRADDSSVEGHYSLGGAYLTQGNLDLAHTQWMRTIEIDPQHALALNQLGSVAFLHGRLAEAEQFYSRALAVEPKNPEGHYNLAMILAQTGRGREAIRHYELFLAQVYPEHRQLIPEVQARIQKLRQIEN